MEISRGNLSAGEEAVYKCRKCRHTLFNGDFVVNGHGKAVGPPSEDAEGDECHAGGVPAEDAVWYLEEDTLPGWVEALVNEANWIKGKITCPKCHAKIGSFDFVNGTKCPCGRCVLPSVHLVKGKIDREGSGAAVTLPLRAVPTGTIEKQDTESTKEEPPQASSASSSRILPLELITNRQESSFQVQDVYGMDKFGISVNKIRKPCKDISNYLKPKRRKVSDCPIGDHDTEMEAPEEFICAICLDIYHHPFVCHPCKHIFCEICLRNLAKLDPQHTRCPLCRQHIGTCLPDSDRCQLTKSLYPKYYKARQTLLNKTRNFPLPWQMNYRLWNLSSGRLGYLWQGWQDGNAQTRVTHTIWESLSTISILIVQLIIAVLTFIIGYYGWHYILLVFTWMLQELEKVTDEMNTFWTL